jgi:hypothetical protein
MAQQPLEGQGLLIIEAPRSHPQLDTPHSVRLLWTSDQPEAGTSTWQHTTLTRSRHSCPGGIQTRSPSKRAAAEPRLTPRDHWNRLHSFYAIELFQTPPHSLKLNYWDWKCNDRIDSYIIRISNKLTPWLRCNTARKLFKLHAYT